MSLFRRFTALATMLLLTTALGVAQETGGSIRGTVTDPSGATISNAKVIITNTDTGVVVREMRTQPDGGFVALRLPIGNYSVTAEGENFKKKTISQIKLNVGDALNYPMSLEVGAASQVVEVQAAALQVETEQATSGTLITGDQVRELSINNRNYEQLVSLAPGVSYGGGDQLYVGTTNPSGQTNTVPFSINGQRTSANNWTVDGADNVDRGSNLTLLTYPSVDAIAEFKVLRNVYTAEYGRAAAGHVNVITRSGTKEFHGGAYYFGRNDVFNANTYINNRNGIDRPPLRYHNFGYTIGGPAAIPGLYNPEEKKTFFFFSQEFRRQSVPANFTAILPTSGERTGTFTRPVCLDVVAAGTAPATCTNVGTQVTAINPIAQQYISAIYGGLPTPTDATTHQFFGTRQSRFNYRQELLRLDHYFSPNWNVAFRFVNDTIPTEEPGGLFTNALLPGVSNTKTDSPGRSYVVKTTNTFGPTWLMELGYAKSYGAIISDPTGLIGTDQSNVNVALPFASTLGRIPGIVMTNGASSIAGFGPYDDFNRNHNVFANLSKTLTKHTLKFGATYHHYQKTENAAGNNAGTFTFNNARSVESPGGVALTGAALADARFQQTWANFLLGNVNQFTQISVDLTPDINQNQFEYYFQDDWKVLPNLTLNLGVRHSFFFQPYDNNGLLTNFVPSLYNPANAPTISTTNGNITSAAGTFDPLNGIAVNNSTSPFGNKIAPEPKWDLAPRVGFAWDPFGTAKTSIRGGYGISYDSALVGILEQNIFANRPFASSITIQNTRFEDVTAASPVVSASPVALRGTPYSADIPYVQNWSLDVQRDLGWNMIAAAGYYGNKGTHLLGVADVNQPQPGALAAAGLPAAAINAVRPYRGYGPINQVVPWFTSNYHALQTSLQKSFGGVSQVTMNYTWSKGLTTAQTDRSSAPQSTYDLNAEYGPSQLDRRHIFNANFVYELPWYRTQQGIVGKVLGGWQTSGIAYFQTGVPLTITTSGVDPAGIGVNLAASAASGRPDLIGDPNGAHGTDFRVGDTWFNPAAFAAVPAGQARVGTSGRGVVYGPGFQRVDFSLFKNLALTEQLKLQFRAEAFNVFNHTNPNLVNSVFGNAVFGRVTSYRDPREMSFGLKLNF